MMRTKLQIVAAERLAKWLECYWPQHPDWAARAWGRAVALRAEAGLPIIRQLRQKWACQDQRR